MPRRLAPARSTPEVGADAKTPDGKKPARARQNAVRHFGFAADPEHVNIFDAPGEFLLPERFGDRLEVHPLGVKELVGARVNVLEKEDLDTVLGKGGRWVAHAAPSSAVSCASLGDESVIARRRVDPRRLASPVLGAFVVILACGGQTPQATRPAFAVSAPAEPRGGPPSQAAAPTVDEAREFLADVEERLRHLWVSRDEATWVNENFITDDTEALAAAGEAAAAAYVGEAIQRSRRFDVLRGQLPAEVARKLYLLSFAQTIPAPHDASERTELASIESSMSSSYGKGRYCPSTNSSLRKYVKASGATANGESSCLRLDQLSRILATSRQFDELVEAWRGWHNVAAPLKASYSRYVELANAGAREIGYDDVGALWRAGYDMPPADFSESTSNASGTT